MSQSPSPKASPGGDPLQLDQVRAFGWLGERVDRAHAAVRNVRSSIWWNLGSMWGWEHAGRWLRNMSYFQTYTDEVEPEVAEGAQLFVEKGAAGELDLDYEKLQIGPYSDGEVLKGLLAYHGISGDRRVLSTARAIGERMVRDHHLSSHPYKALAVASLLDLAEASGEASYGKVAVEIAEEQQVAFLESKLHGAACAEILDAYIDLYRDTGDRRYLDWALKGWKPIRDRMFVTGGLGEVLDFTAPPGESDLMCETCQTSWWMILNLHLWRETGDMRYLDLAERILYNQFAWGQSHRGEGGGFCAGGNIDQAMRGIHNYFCCDNEGTLGLFEALAAIFTLDEKQAVVSANLFFDAEARVAIGGRSLTIRQKTEYPERGHVRLAVETETPAFFTLRVRIPGWTAPSGASVNGEPARFRMQGPYLAVDREWKDGDALSVVFPMPMSVEADITGRGIRSGAVSIDGKVQQAKRVAVFYGPVISAMFRTGHGNDLSWVWTGDYTDVLDSGGDAGMGYPGSRADILEVGDKSYDSGDVPQLTRVRVESGLPEISWDAGLGDSVRVRRTIRVLPGLPVTLEARDEITGWDGNGRLLCSGLRFATVKDASSGYGVCSIPYPAPVVITKPDLDNHVVWAGVFGLSETPANDAELPVTGLYLLNNGYFSAICAYDSEPVDSVVSRQTDKWTGLYLEPKAAREITLTRRTVFPLLKQPLNQTMILQRAEKAGQVTARLANASDGRRSLVLDGPVLSGAPILVPRAAGLEPGWSVHNPGISSRVFDYDEERVLVYVDTPGDYTIDSSR